MTLCAHDVGKYIEYCIIQLSLIDGTGGYGYVRTHNTQMLSNDREMKKKYLIKTEKKEKKKMNLNEEGNEITKQKSFKEKSEFKQMIDQ